jgi:hypothetical protein
MSHQHEIADLGLIPRRCRVEAGRAIFDGLEPIGREGFAGCQGDARQRLGGQALHGIAVEAGDLDGGALDGFPER